MPYIPDKERAAYQLGTEALRSALKLLPPNSLSGHLNFVVSFICAGLMNGAGYAYQAAVLSGLHEAENELRRRFLIPLEDRKCEENGDIV